MIEPRVCVEDVVGTAVRRLRRRRKLKTALFAESADIDRTFLSKLETGHVPITMTQLCRLAKAMDVKPSAILTEAEGLVADINSRDWSFISKSEQDQLLRDILEDR